MSGFNLSEEERRTMRLALAARPGEAAPVKLTTRSGPTEGRPILEETNTVDLGSDSCRGRAMRVLVAARQCDFIAQAFATKNAKATMSHGMELMLSLRYAKKRPSLQEALEVALGNEHTRQALILPEESFPAAVPFRYYIYVDAHETCRRNRDFEDYCDGLCFDSECPCCGSPSDEEYNFKMVKAQRVPTVYQLKLAGFDDRRDCYGCFGTEDEFFPDYSFDTEDDVWDFVRRVCSKYKYKSRCLSFHLIEMLPPDAKPLDESTVEDLKNVGKGFTDRSYSWLQDLCIKEHPEMKATIGAALIEDYTMVTWKITDLYYNKEDM